jgi:hypothetical protein
VTLSSHCCPDPEGCLFQPAARPKLTLLLIVRIFFDSFFAALHCGHFLFDHNFN